MKSTDKFEFIINKLIVLALPSNIYEKKYLKILFDQFKAEWSLTYFYIE